MHVGLIQDQADPNSPISFECDWDIYDDNYDFLSANIEWFVNGTLVLMENFQGDPQGGEMYTNTQSSDSLGISQNQEADVYCALNNLDDGWASSVSSISMTLTAEWNTGP